MAWKRKFGTLGHSVVELLQAEIDALFLELASAFVRAGRAWFLRAVVLAVGAVFLGVCMFTLIFALSDLLGLKIWVSGLIVAGLLGILMGVLWWWASKMLVGFVLPTRILQRHISGHLSWWRDQFAEVPSVKNQPSPVKSEKRAKEASRATPESAVDIDEHDVVITEKDVIRADKLKEKVEEEEV